MSEVDTILKVFLVDVATTYLQFVREVGKVTNLKYGFIATIFRRKRVSAKFRTVYKRKDQRREESNSKGGNYILSFESNSKITEQGTE